MAFTLAQQKALALVPKVTGLISLIFSALIVISVARDKQKRSSTYHRLLAGISCVDISSSFWLGLSTWPIPRDSGVLWASGTTATCTLQGFFTEFGVASSFYNASLSFYYLFVIRYGWKDFRMRKVEPFMHTIPVVWGLWTAIAGLPLTLFNNANLWCWIAPHPLGCQDNPDVECIRGDNADIYRWAFFYGPLWLMIIIVTVNVILVIRYVRKIELSTAIYRFGARFDQHTAAVSTVETAQEAEEEEITTTVPVEESSRRASRRSTVKNLTRTREVTWQCMGYAGAFYLNWIALTLVRLIQTFNGKVHFSLLLIAAMMTPLQGLPNFIVYLAPRFAKLKRERPHAGFWNWVSGSLAPNEVQSSTAENTPTP